MFHKIEYIYSAKIHTMKFLLFILTFFVFIGSASAQSLSPTVIASQGDFYSVPAGSISWTLGEPMSETYIAGSNILTQGFQQPFSLITATLNINSIGSVSAFPNPVTNELTINFSELIQGEYSIYVFDILGQQLSALPVALNSINTSQKISFENYSDGTYFVKIISTLDNSFLKTIKINKAQ